MGACNSGHCLDAPITVHAPMQLITGRTAELLVDVGARAGGGKL